MNEAATYTKWNMYCKGRYKVQRIKDSTKNKKVAATCSKMSLSRTQSYKKYLVLKNNIIKYSLTAHYFNVDLTNALLGSELRWRTIKKFSIFYDKIPFLGLPEDLIS